MASFQDRAQHAIAQLDKEVSRVCVFWFCVLFLPVYPPQSVCEEVPSCRHCISLFSSCLTMFICRGLKIFAAGGWG